MKAPYKPQSDAYANYAKDLSISFASLLPREANDVARFLFEAAYAFGEREVDLARAMGVTQATFSGWKKRGALPEAHALWFVDQFPKLVLTGSNPAQHEGFRHAGLPIVLHLLKRTSFNPFMLEDVDDVEAVSLCFSYIGGMSRLALFVAHRLQLPMDVKPEDHEPLLAAIVAPMIMEVGKTFKRVSHRVSQ